MINAIDSITSLTKINSGSALNSLPKTVSTTDKSFGDYLSEAVSTKVQALQNFEKASQAATSGQITELDLISAVNEADIQLQAFKVIWEKVLQKYETIIEKTNL